MKLGLSGLRRLEQRRHNKHSHNADCIFSDVTLVCDDNSQTGAHKWPGLFPYMPGCQFNHRLDNVWFKHSYEDILHVRGAAGLSWEGGQRSIVGPIVIIIIIILIQSNMKLIINVDHRYWLCQSLVLVFHISSLSEQNIETFCYFWLLFYITWENITVWYCVFHYDILIFEQGSTCQ